VIASEPAVSVVVVQIAAVPIIGAAAQPVMPEPPDFQATDAVGLDAPESVAVSVTEAREVDGLADEVTVTVGTALFTVWVMELLAVALFVSPA
jgi:negative regulator of sigma E activity